MGTLRTGAQDAGRRPTGRTVTDAEGGRYRVITRYERPGRRVQLPPAARGVSVEPLRDGSAVRITYLRPVREVPFVDGDADRDAGGDSGVDGAHGDGTADASVSYIN